ncbi:hypothetical protein BEM40_018820 [Escherichia sp. MOD1-EC5451]|nr:hypothetical protein BEM40_018820 [Escherichia sp. MOD1-EC5451]
MRLRKAGFKDGQNIRGQDRPSGEHAPGQSLNKGANSCKINFITHNDALLVVIMNICVIKIAAEADQEHILVQTNEG